MESTECKLDVNTIEVSWNILNFSLNGKNKSEFLKSPDFKLGPANFTWYLGLYPKGFGDKNSDFVSLYIFRIGNSNLNVEVEYSFAILDSKGEKVNKYRAVAMFNDNRARGIQQFISISDIKEYLISNKLTIVSKMRAGVNIIQIPSLPELTIVAIDELSQDLQKLFENQKFTDVIIAVKGKTFNAHKAILSTRSSVFSALFEHEMQENINNIVDIEDAEPNVVEEMLRFIYTGKVKDINLIACELLRISDKYFLEGLKSICEDTLGKSLSVENVLQVLSLADLYNAKTLKTKALEFSVTHAKEIIETAAFNSLEHLNAQILSELFRKLALKPST